MEQAELEFWSEELQTVWDYIGSDMLQAVGHDMTRDEVFECCCDHVGVSHRLLPGKLTEFWNRNRKLDGKLKKMAFPYASYGF
jgi:hypothetical protein